jgi:xanthine dehydrogenase small subunit
MAIHAPKDEGIGLTVNGRAVTIDEAHAASSLLDWLRLRAHLTGTKEGCGEGDCGACTVILEQPDAGGCIRRAVNSCLLLVGQLQGATILTVEGLCQADGSQHPAQVALAAAGGTQCGFCTPGFVMSAVAYASEADKPDLHDIHDALAGNLCRCTGYRPIVEAVASITPLKAELRGATPIAARHLDAEPLRTTKDFRSPVSLQDLLVLKAKDPEAVLITGGTDLNVPDLYGRQRAASYISTRHVTELRAISTTRDGLIIGAAVPYTDMSRALFEMFPYVKDYITRLGSTQIRNVGTIGGNLGTASPIGDMPPLLLAVNATVEVASVRGRRTIPIDEFFKGYRKTDLERDEVIVAVSIPRPTSDTQVFCEKVSKRRDQDISTVCAGFSIRVEGGVIGAVRLAFGGMANVPKRALNAERVLTNRSCEPAVFEEAAQALSRDVAPMTDVRATREYRLHVAQNLLRRLGIRLLQPSTLMDVHAL